MSLILKKRQPSKVYSTKLPKIKSAYRPRAFKNPYDCREAKLGGEILPLFFEVEKLLKNLGKEKKDLDPTILYKTHYLIQKMRNYAKNNNLWWDEPLGNISIDQEIVLEWWHNNKTITIYVGTHAIDFIKAWGADMDTEMEDGLLTLNGQDMIESLWQWLVN